MKKFFILIAIILVFPLFLHIFNPELELGGLGLILSFWGLFVSPIILLVLLFFFFTRNL